VIGHVDTFECIRDGHAAGVPVSNEISDFTPCVSTE